MTSRSSPGGRRERFFLPIILKYCKYLTNFFGNGTPHIFQRFVCTPRAFNTLYFSICVSSTIKIWSPVCVTRLLHNLVHPVKKQRVKNIYHVVLCSLTYRSNTKKPFIMCCKKMSCIQVSRLMTRITSYYMK